jgi:hypothetical protein
MTLDADLQAAYDAAKDLGHDNIMLDCLKQQDYRNDIVSRAEERQAERERLAGIQQQFLDFGGDKSEDEDAYMKLFIELAAKYMTTGTATLDATILADAVADAKRLKAAMEAAWSVYETGIAAIRA